MEIEQSNRRLAAVLAADVVGYSRLMASDESGTLNALNRHREDAFNPAVARHNGRIVKLMGDGTLVEFASVVDAVNCAIAVQRAVASETQSGPRIVLRIGINLGDIITQANDIYGDGVNIAARLEQLAKPGGICISSVVNESMGGRVSEAFDDGGEVNVKNIERPLKVFHWHPDKPASVGGSASPKPATATRREGASIAVLPFDNMSQDPEQEYFSDGISEDIITDLSKVSGLTVIGRNSSFAYKGKSTDLRLVGQQLGVSHVLEGSIRRAGQRVRITAQLIDAATGSHVWADRYDRDLTDIFALQDEVTLEIVSALKIRLTSTERANISNAGTINLEAHENFMRMRGLLFHPSIDAEIWRQAVAFGEQAIALDPGYAQAHAILAMMHLLDFHNHWSGASGEAALKTAHEFSRHALELGPDDMVPNQIGAVMAKWAGKLNLARTLVDKAMASSPDNATGLFIRGEISLASGQLQEAIVDCERAIRLDPAVRHLYLQCLAMAHFLSGNYETAALMFRERIFWSKIPISAARGWPRHSAILDRSKKRARPGQNWSRSILTSRSKLGLRARISPIHLLATASWTGWQRLVCLANGPCGHRRGRPLDIRSSARSWLTILKPIWTTKVPHGPQRPWGTPGDTPGQTLCQAPFEEDDTMPFRYLSSLF